MDNATVATHPHTHETAVAAEHQHVALPQHRHHFETQEQQREAGTFGMWLFLLTEIMFFGGLFMAYLLYRNWYYDAFVASSNTLGIGLGTVLASWAAMACWILFHNGANMTWAPISTDTNLFEYCKTVWQQLPADVTRLLPYACATAMFGVAPARCGELHSE